MAHGIQAGLPLLRSMLLLPYSMWERQVYDETNKSAKQRLSDSKFADKG